MMHPLLLTPTTREKIWGGHRLGPGIGEAVAMGHVGEEDSVVAFGPDAGRRLSQLRRRWGHRLTGLWDLHPDDPLPWLVKWLDARHDLSIQVHPPEGHVRAKHEAWVVLDAAPGAQLLHGLADGVTLDQLHDAHPGALPDLLARRAALPRSCHLLPGGTVHAFGAGVFALEVQTPSEVTWRLWDWGRDRPLHPLHARTALRDTRPPAPSVAPDRTGTWHLGTLDRFRLDWLQGPLVVPVRTGWPTGLVALSGSPRLGWGADRLALSPGHTALWPAELSGHLTLGPGDAILRITEPDSHALSAAA